MLQVADQSLPEGGFEAGYSPEVLATTPSLLHIWTITPSEAGATPSPSEYTLSQGSPTSYKVTSSTVLRQAGRCGQGQCLEVLEGSPGLHSVRRPSRLLRSLVIRPTPKTPAASTPHTRLILHLGFCSSSLLTSY